MVALVGGAIGLDEAVEIALDGLTRGVLVFLLVSGEKGGQVGSDDLVEVLDCGWRARHDDNWLCPVSTAGIRWLAGWP